MKGKQIATFEWLLKIDLLIVCLFLFFPSPLICTDFALPYREYFMLLLSLIGAFGSFYSSYICLLIFVVLMLNIVVKL